MTRGLLATGFSEEAKFIEEASQAGSRRLRGSFTLGIDPVVNDELAAVWEECRQPNWDGFDAVAVTQDVLRNTYVLLESLPLGCPAPSIGAEPDGSLTLEWHRSARRTLSVSVAPDGDLHFAALLGPNRIYGTVAFFGDVPEGILNLIGRVYQA